MKQLLQDSGELVGALGGQPQQVKKSGKAEDAFEKYCSDLERTKMWGGQHELLAERRAHDFMDTALYRCGRAKDCTARPQLATTAVRTVCTSCQLSGVPDL